MADPVGGETVVSLARPGGNITGTTFLRPELIANASDGSRTPFPDSRASPRFGILLHTGNVQWKAC
jgi:hypothetical protein